MNSTVAKEMLTGFCRSWQKRLCVNIGIKAITITLLLMAAINVLTTISAGGLILIALSSTILLFTGLFFLTKVTRISSLTIAHHLNRTIPELEESCELLLKPEGNSSVLEKMQRKRTLSAFSSLHLNDLLPGTIPQGKWLAGFGIFLLAFIGSTFVPENWLDKPAFQKASVFGGVDTVRNGQDDLTLPTVKSAKIQITPPAYTNKLPYKLSSLQITAEEGALVSWDIELSEHVQEILLVFSGGDTMTLRQGKDLHWRGKRRVLDSGFYHISVSRPGTRAWNSEFHRIDVLKDRPPTIVVLEPEQRTEIALTESRDLAIRAIVDDDYGVVNAHIIATVTSGSGESVKFRESKLDFTSRRERNRSRHEFSRELDLDALGMGLGDELYFFVEAWDNRQPAANRRRSETYFVILNDTTGAVTSAFFGLAINPLPEYFRSQRQIIIDTEKLVAEKTQLSKKEFQRRSNNLGIDQKALRLRYGQFLGEESENGLAIETAPNAETEDGFLDEHEEEFSAEGFEAFGAGKENHEQSGIPDELRHNHDYEENATLFSQSIKDQLKAALAEMWDAELHLRTLQPKNALPYEYRALVLLKKVQQESRIYVKRVGFEPPPLKPDEKRLTGDMSGIETQTESRSPHASKGRFFEIRKALQVLHLLKKQRVFAEHSGILELAGRELARQAMSQPGDYLPALNHLRQVIGQIDNKEEICQKCLLPVEAALWDMLPEASQSPHREFSDKSDVSARYFKNLGVPD